MSNELNETIAHLIDLYEAVELENNAICRREKYDELASKVRLFKRTLNKQQKGLQDKLLTLIEYLVNKSAPSIEQASDTVR